MGNILRRDVRHLGLEHWARVALTERGFESKAGYCQKWARQVVQRAHGSRFNAFFRDTAAKTGLAFRGSRYDVTGSGELLPGDLLYKTRGSGGSGHVGIYIGDGLVAENSSFHRGRFGARGTRTLRQYGAFDVQVRLR